MTADDVRSAAVVAIVGHLATYLPEVDSVVHYGNGTVVLIKPSAPHDATTAQAYQVVVSVSKL